MPTQIDNTSIIKDITHFPFQLFETINAHGYSMNGNVIHIKVLFIRYVDDNENFDCVVESKGIKSFSIAATLWRDGDPVPPDRGRLGR